MATITLNDIPGTGDFKVLNFALALEALETELYVQALQRLTGGGTGGRDALPGTAITGLGLSASAANPDVFFTQQFTTVETNHRNFLEAAIPANGGVAITHQLNLKFSFTVGGVALANMTRQQVIDLLLDAEATGVAAYLGGVKLFTPHSPFLQTAGAIQGTEARHTAVFARIVKNQFGESANVAPLANQNNGLDPVPTGNTNAALTGAANAGAIPNTPAGTPPDPNNVLLKVSPFITIAAGAGPADARSAAVRSLPSSRVFHK